jgi:hypothetical protein
MGVSAAFAGGGGGSCSSTCFTSTAGCSSGSFWATVPLFDSSGVMGRAEGMVRDRRWGMAGTMRESGRRACRACLCAAAGVSPTMTVGEQTE